MSPEQNELMTRIGPGTPAGKLLRRYWQPVALVDEFQGRRPVRPVAAARTTAGNASAARNSRRASSSKARPAGVSGCSGSTSAGTASACWTR